MRCSSSQRAVCGVAQVGLGRGAALGHHRQSTATPAWHCRMRQSQLAGLAVSSLSNQIGYCSPAAKTKGRALGAGLDVGAAAGGTCGKRPRDTGHASRAAVSGLPATWLTAERSSPIGSGWGAEDAAAIASAMTRVNTTNKRLENKPMKISLIRPATVFLNTDGFLSRIVPKQKMNKINRLLESYGCLLSDFADRIRLNS
jgi:hypothetical protein